MRGQFKSVLSRRAAVMVALSALLAACVSSAAASVSHRAARGASAQQRTVARAAKSAVAVAKSALAKAERPQTQWAGPTSSPSPAKHKTVYVIGCSANVEGCILDYNAAIAAAKVMGWTVKSIQTDGSPQGYNNAYNVALSAKPSGLLVAGIPSSLVANALKRAKQQGVPVVSMAANNHVGPIRANFKGGLYAEVGPDQKQMGALAADYIVAQSNGKATIGVFNSPEFPVLQVRIAGFDHVIKQCTGCTLVSPVDVPVANLTTQGTSAVVQYLRSNPSIGYFFGSYDGANVFAAPAVSESGRSVTIVGQDGGTPNLNMIRKGGPEDASVAYSLVMIGWASVDQLNRAFHHQRPAPQWSPTGGAIPLKVIVKSNAPKSGPYIGDFNWQAKFKALWGIK